MCWNQQVSLNTFLFSSFVLVLIVYNNYYTQYKIPELNNAWMYIFLSSVICMQLLEFFIWRNIDNKLYNHIFSVLAMALLVVQPMLSIMLLSNILLRDSLLILYLLLTIPFIVYNSFTYSIHSVKSELGHLRWKFFKIPLIGSIVWVFFFLFSFVYEKKWVEFVFAFGLLCISFYNYYNDYSFGSIWCWLINIMAIYYAFYLLIYLPFFTPMKILP